MICTFAAASSFKRTAVARLETKHGGRLRNKESKSRYHVPDHQLCTTPLEQAGQILAGLTHGELPLPMGASDGSELQSSSLTTLLPSANKGSLPGPLIAPWQCPAVKLALCCLYQLVLAALMCAEELFQERAGLFAHPQPCSSGTHKAGVLGCTLIDKFRVAS